MQDEFTPQPPRQAEFTCDYRTELYSNAPPPAPTIHVTVESETPDPPDEPEGVVLWKRNNQPSPLFYPKKPQEADSGASDKQRRGGTFSAVCLLLAAFAGVVCFCMFGSVRSVQSAEQLSAFLLPVLLQEPQPFAFPEQASAEMTLQAAVWRAVQKNGAQYRTTDEQGRLTVPAKDVETACSELFGSSYHLPYKTPQNSTFFVYEPADDTYRVLPQSSAASASQIKSVSDENGAVTVLVESGPKRYNYKLLVDTLRGEFYLAAIEEQA